jgi:two-component system, NtrC family, sensor kinase
MTQTQDGALADLRHAYAALQVQLDEHRAERDAALAREAALAEVLDVINASPGNLALVFEAMLEKATRLCDSSFGTLVTYNGESFNHVAGRGVPPVPAEFFRAPIQPRPGMTLYRVVNGEDVVQVADITDDEVYWSGNSARRALADLGGARTQLLVALRKDDTLLGVFNIFRQSVRLFSDKQISLLQNFAAQAVVAMENARLLGELRERTGELQESLEYQTATSDVLKIISRSTFDLDPVFQAVVATAVRLCRADQATIYRYQDGEYRWAAGYSLAPDYERIERAVRIRPGTGTLVGRVALGGRTVEILDAWTDPAYEVKEDARVGGIHTLLGVPLLREGSPIGVIGLARRRIEPYTEKQIELVTTFADQAVIATENARLLGELQERTAALAQRNSEYGERIEQQSATIERTGREPRRGRTVIAMVWSGFGAQCRARS